MVLQAALTPGVGNPRSFAVHSTRTAGLIIELTARFGKERAVAGIDSAAAVAGANPLHPDCYD
jgi:hypothetical protein